MNLFITKALILNSDWGRPDDIRTPEMHGENQPTGNDSFPSTITTSSEKKMKYINKKSNVFSLFTTIFLIACSLLSQFVYGKADDNASNGEMLNQYIQSKGKDIITFDAANIKQFWIDKSIVKNDVFFVVQLNKTNNNYESPSLKIQLSNILETQDCRIEVISQDSNTVFSVFNSEALKIADSSVEPNFIQYHISSAVFHLEDTEDFSFNLKFSSKSASSLSINKIILSFSDNKKSAFLGSPGFNQLMKQFLEKGIDVPNSKVQYIFLPEYNKVFIKIPTELAEQNPFLYHIYPIDNKNLSPGREQHGFNNGDFRITTRKKSVIPKPYASDSKYTIVQLQLPSYQYSLLRIGQYNSQAKIWEFELK